jgi:cobalt/nickel transport protein
MRDRRCAGRTQSIGALILAVAVLGVSTPAAAHFQMLYVPESALERASETSLALVFTHPFNGGPTMNMGLPRSFYVVSQRGEDGAPVKTDLKKFLQPMQWQGVGNQAGAYQATLPRAVVRSMGDYVFALEPEPYLEKEEDKYIQQFTKMIMNVGGVPGNWDQPLGLVTEIQPLNKPYANWVGGVFSGIVLSQGKPVPFAKIELEYVNHTPDLTGNSFASTAAVTAPQASFANLSVRTDANGAFSIGLSRAGWWGICALGSGPVTQHEGKPLSQDAVLWVQAKDMR